MTNQYKLKNTIKYPTSIIINGLSNLGLEVAESLLAQGGYVIIIDSYNDANLQKLNDKFGQAKLISFLDYSIIPHLEEDIRRLDYIFYLSHVGGASVEEISSQSFLKYSNYLDTTLSLATKFEAKFLLTTSIKAHQMLMSRMDIDVNFGIRSDAKHTVYTEMEVQRYAESLCLEYATKKDLNVRIVRVGEIIGEGMDFEAQTQFTSLIIDAVNGNNLKLVNDGLDTEWFLHLLDAAYGVIKAQFSRDTEGEIFSLAYENSITHLSLAYKIQELEPAAKEIVFSEGISNLPPLRLHKPAPNLTKIGWKPRVDFEKAVAESLASAKIHILQNHIQTQRSAGSDAGIVGKIRSFLSIAEQNPTPAELEMLNSGPVSRLIAERRRQELVRNQSLDRADDSIRSRWRERNRTPWQRYKAWIWRNFLDMRTNFAFLRRVTPAQFAGYIVMTVILVYLYFSVVSPVIIFARNLVVVYSTLPTIQVAVDNRNFNQLNNSAAVISAALAENEVIWRRTEPIANLTGAQKYYASVGLNLQSFSQLYAGVQNIAYAVEPVNTYLGQYRDNVNFRLNTESYLSTSSAGTDYTTVLSELNVRSAFAEVGVNKLNQASRNLTAQDLDLWPAPVTTLLTGYVNQSIQLTKVAQLADISTYANDLLGVDTPKSFLAVIVDNSRPMPIGGEISAYALISIQNGAISDIRVQSINEFDAELNQLPDYAFAEINLNSYQAKNSNNIAIRDLAFIGDPELFGDIAATVWDQELNRNIDGVIVVNYNFITDLLEQFGSVNIENQDFDSTNLLKQLADMQTATPTVQRRNDLMAQISANLIDRILENYGSGLFKFVDVVSNSASKKDVTISSIDSKFTQAVRKYNLGQNLAAGTDLPVKIAFVADPKNISPARFPAMNQALKFNVNQDSSVNVNINLKFPAIANADYVSLCTSAIAKDITVAGVDSSRVKPTKGNGQSCVIVDVVTETDLVIKWDTLAIETLTNPEYNLSLGVSKLAGLEVVSDIELSLNPALSLIEIEPDLSSIGNKVAFTQSLETDQLIKLLLSKN